MGINTVKLQGEGYLLNGNMSVPGNAPGNKEYELIKQWLAEGNTPEPEFTDAELLAQENTTKVSEAKQYLADTDWIVVKINEANINGEDISDLLTKYADIFISRADARVLINSLE